MVKARRFDQDNLRELEPGMPLFVGEEVPMVLNIDGDKVTTIDHPRMPDGSPSKDYKTQNYKIVNREKGELRPLEKPKTITPEDSDYESLSKFDREQSGGSFHVGIN